MGPCPPARHRARACYECPSMPDLLTTYAELQPDKIAVVDDRRGDDVRTVTYAEFEHVTNHLAHVLRGPRRRPRREGRVVRPELDRRRQPRRRRPQGRGDRRAAELPPVGRGGGLRHRPQRRHDRLRRRRVRPAVRAHPRRDPQGRAPPRVRRSGAGGDDRRRRADGGRADGTARRRARRRRGRRDDDLHVGHDRQAQGCAAPQRRRPAAGGRDAAVHRLPARRRLHHDRPAVPQRARRVHGHRHGPRPDHRAAAQVRPRGLAAPARRRTGRRRRSPRRRRSG